MNGHGLDVQRLVALLVAAPGEGPVVSIYLVPDPVNAAATEIRIKDIIKEGVAAIRGEARLDAAARDRALAALDRAASAIGEATRASPRGTSIAFADGARVETFHAPCELKSRVVVGPHAYVGPLAGLLESADRYGVVLVDKRATKIFAWFLDALEPLASFADPDEKNVAWAGWLGRDQLKANHHRDVVFHRHIARTADALFALHRRTPFDRIVLAGHPPATIAKLEQSLHPYLATRVVARESWEHGASSDELRARLAAIDERLESEKERELIARASDRARGEFPTAIGADATLAALWAGRVATLLAPDGAKLAGRACEKCRFLAVDGARCRECGGPTRPIDDLVEEASELALLTGAKVRLIACAKPELESLGGFAALLRF